MHRAGRRFFDPTLYEGYPPPGQYQQQPVPAPVYYRQAPPTWEGHGSHDYIQPQRAEVYRTKDATARRELTPEEYQLFRNYVNARPSDVVYDKRLDKGWNFNQSTGRWSQSTDPFVKVDMDPQSSVQPAQQYSEYITPAKQPVLRSLPPPQFMPQYVEYIEPAPQPVQRVVKYVRPAPQQFVEYVRPAPQQVVELREPQYLEYPEPPGAAGYAIGLARQGGMTSDPGYYGVSRQPINGRMYGMAPY